MKKILLLLILFVANSISEEVITKGTIKPSGSIYLNTYQKNNNNNSVTSLGLNSGLEYYLNEQFGVGLRTFYSWTREAFEDEADTHHEITPLLTWNNNFKLYSIFVSAGPTFGYSKDIYYGHFIKIGSNIFINQHIAVIPQWTYQSNLYNAYSNYNTISIGFGCFINKNKVLFSAF
ncbi:hypothetical protein KAJ27_18770 [bacterium]|nr:hypothetical protein [bacterium]